MGLETDDTRRTTSVHALLLTSTSRYFASSQL